MLKTMLQDLAVHNKYKDIFDTLLQLPQIDKSFYKNTMMLSARYYQLREAEMQGVLADGPMQWATLNKSVVEQLSELPAELEYQPTIFAFSKNLETVVVGDLLGLRATHPRFRPNVYIVREEVDKPVEQALKFGRPLLILGSPAAGKTRAVWEGFKKIVSGRIALPQSPFICSPKIIEYHRFKIPNTALNQRKIAFFNDLHHFYEKFPQDTDKMLRDLILNGFQIVATCRTGREFERVKQQMDEELFNHFVDTTVRIPLCAPDILDKLKRADKKLVPFFEDFDKNIGSIFMGLSQMRLRYQTDLGDRRATHPVSEVAYQVLFALKCFYYSSNFEQKDVFATVKIKNFVHALYPQLSESLWNNALKLLQQGSFGLNFLTVATHTLQMESVYAQKIVQPVPREESEVEEVENFILETIIRIYPEGRTRRALGFYTKVYEFNKQIYLAETYSAAVQQFNTMQNEGIKANIVTFHTLMSKSNNYGICLEWFEKLNQAKLIPDLFTFNTLLSKANDYETCLEWFEKLKEAKLMPNLVTFATLMTKSNDYKTCLEWFEKLKQAKLMPDIVTFTTLMSKSNDYAACLAWFEKLKEAKLIPNVVTLTTLMSKSNDYETCLEWFEQLKEAKLIPNVVTFTILMSKSNDYETRLEWLEQVKQAKFTPNVVTFNTLISKSNDYETCLEWFEKLKETKLIPDLVTFNTLISKSNDYETCLEWFEKLKETKLMPDIVTLTTLMSKSNDYETCLEWFEQLKQAKIVPNVVTFNTLISKSGSYKKSLRWFNILKERHLKPNIITFDNLLSKLLKRSFRIDSIDYQLFMNHLKEILILKILVDVNILDKIKRLTSKRESIFIAEMQLLLGERGFFNQGWLVQLTAHWIRTHKIEDIAFIEKHESFIRQNPDTLWAYVDSVYQRGDYPLASRLLEHVVQRDCDYYRLKGDLLHLAPFEERVAIYENALALAASEPQKATVYHGLARLIYQHERADLYFDALQYCQIALKYSASNGELSTLQRRFIELIYA
jgi:hypothetical protein